MALTPQECRDLFQAVEDSGKQLTVGFNRRYAPTYLNVKKQIAKRTGPAVLSCRVNSPGISGSYWMADPAIGGAILGEACHFVDLMHWLLDSEPVEVSAYSLHGLHSLCPARARYSLPDGTPKGKCLAWAQCRPGSRIS